MKKTFFAIITLFVIATSNFSFKPDETGKVIAIINKAGWCKICKLYEGRAISVFNENNTDHFFQFLELDLTDKSTIKSSMPAIYNLGLEKATKGDLSTGILSFYDSKTKVLIAQVTVASKKDELAATMKMVREKISK